MPFLKIFTFGFVREDRYKNEPENFFVKKPISLLAIRMQENFYRKFFLSCKIFLENLPKEFFQNIKKLFLLLQPNSFINFFENSVTVTFFRSNDNKFMMKVNNFYITILVNKI